MTSPILDKTLGRRLRWLMFFRVIFTSFLLGTTAVVQFWKVGGASGDALKALYALIGAVYFLTFIYAVILPRLFNVAAQAYIQIGGDLLFTTCVIYLTGGLESTFSFMYILTIINAGILLKVRGSLLAASFASILYGALLDLHYYRYIQPYLTRLSFADTYRATDVLNTILMNMGAFYLVALLSGYLAKQADESRLNAEKSLSDLERLEDLSENMIQSIDSGLLTVGAKGEILSFNAAAERITGFRVGDVKGESYLNVFPGLSLERQADGRTDTAWNWTFAKANGERLFLEMELVGLRDRYGAHWGRLLVFRDKTRIRQMEDEVKRIERLAAIGEMAAGIAHEIRNPLASMSGSLQLLEQDFQEGGQNGRLMAIIRREMDRLNRIVNDFLLFARPRTASPRPLDLSESVLDILEMFKRQGNLGEAIELVEKVAPGIWVIFDEQQLEQILWNLLRNALEAMPGGGRLTLAVDKTLWGKPMGLVTVSDTGKGIPAEDLNRIYDPFFTTKAGGNGLGLSIVYRILEEGGGRIMVTSEPGAGATFSVYLPSSDFQAKPLST